MQGSLVLPIIGFCFHRGNHWFQTPYGGSLTLTKAEIAFKANDGFIFLSNFSFYY